jgi:hypothetical protein
MSLLELFCHVDDFCQQVEPTLEGRALSNGVQHRVERVSNITVNS